MKKLLRQTTKGRDYEVDPFTSAERDVLLKHARPDELQMLRFWFNTGLRPGEPMALWCASRRESFALAAVQPKIVLRSNVQRTKVARAFSIATYAEANPS